MRFLRDRSGVAVLEYGLILGLVAMVAIGLLLTFGNDAERSLDRSGAALPAATAEPRPVSSR